MAQRTAHPYNDIDVIDTRAPRFNQAAVATVTLLGLLTGWWGLIAAMGLQLIVGLRFGRKACLPCVFYFEVIQPRFGEGEVEDSRPPRFANIMGAIFLSASALSYAVGLTTIGTVLAVMVAALATLAAATGFCAGCEIYKVLAHLRGIKPGSVQHIDLAELGESNGGGQVVVQFTHPLCSDCHAIEKQLVLDGHRLVKVDVSKNRELARKYHVSVVPTALSVRADGRVLERLA
ncbi:MAG: DUF4395 family protein [Actinobacteria bacterium]|nr:DUF4395 family protein [Actinomycetota bacterium]